MERKLVRGRKVWEPSLLFPGYIFVGITRCWRAITGTKGIATLFVEGEDGDRRPIPVRASEIEKLKSSEVGGFVVLPDQRSIFEKFRKGDRLEVSSGPLEGKLGIYSGDRKSDRLKVLFNMFGRETSVMVRESDLISA